MMTLDAMESLVYLKLNYHNVHDETVMISTNLFGVKRIYKSLYQDHKEGEGKSMETNVPYLTRKL